MSRRFSDEHFEAFTETPSTATATGSCDQSLARWEEEQLFEEDLRSVLNMLRPNRAERLLGWSEYRTGGDGFRATVTWDAKHRPRPRGNPADAHFVVPQMTDVLESILVGSVKNADELAARQEFEIYRGVIRELHRRLDEMERCYE
jgi:hypothetical protein